MNSLAASSSRRLAAGSTLIELIVVLALMAILVGIAPVAILAPSHEAGVPAAWTRAREAAIRTGRPTTVVDTARRSTLFLPDGRTIEGADDGE